MPGDQMTDRKDFSVTTASDDPAVHLIFLCKNASDPPTHLQLEPQQPWKGKACQVTR